MKNTPNARTSLEAVRGLISAADGSPLEMWAVGGSDPAFLLPRDRRVGAAMCSSYNRLRPLRRRVERLAVAASIRTLPVSLITSEVELPGVANSGDAPLLALLEERLQQELLAGIGLGVLDAWWKPVLQLFNHAGDPVAYAKVGWTPNTAALVETEIAALATLPVHMDGVVTPALLHHFNWRGAPVVVTAPLPPRSRRVGALPSVPPSIETASPVDGSPLSRSAQSRDPAQSRDLIRMGFWKDLLAETESCSEHLGSQITDLVKSAGEVLSATTSTPVRVHGDWVPWNLATDPDSGSLVVWDWEYCHPEGPRGLDAIHGSYQIARVLRGLSDEESFASAHRGAAHHLAVLHAAMIISRRGRAAALGAIIAAEDPELAAAAKVLRSLLDLIDADTSSVDPDDTRDGGTPG